MRCHFFFFFLRLRIRCFLLLLWAVIAACVFCLLVCEHVLPAEDLQAGSTRGVSHLEANRERESHEALVWQGIVL